MNETRFLVSVIVPVYNGRQYLRRCLSAITKSDYSAYELIVVDDASTDDSTQIAAHFESTLIRLSQRSGPAAARNAGAQNAKGDILLFVDSDVLVNHGTISRIAERFTECSDLAAVFGSYDDDPAEAGLISQYKNLYHHFVHQTSDSAAVTFWAGCGAIRKDVFEAIGGFDQQKYKAPSIEDIELGYRLNQAGFDILLDKDLVAKHLKKWNFLGLVRADIFYRAIPWAKLILESEGMVNTLNLKKSQRISAGLIGLSILAASLSFFKTAFLYLGLIFLIAVCVVNRDLYLFFIRKRGLKFAAASMILHFFYYFYSGIVFLSVWFCYTSSKKFLHRPVH